MCWSGNDLDPTLDMFTVDDVNNLLNLIDSAGYAYPASSGYVASYVTVSIKDLDLSALVTSQHGLLDPIGQLSSWLYDRLKELSSWVSSAVESVVRTVWNTVMLPVVSSIRSVAENIWNYMQRIPGTVMDAVSWIRSQISGVWDWIQANVLTPLARSAELISARLTDVGRFFTDTLPRYLADIPTRIASAISDAASKAWDWVQRYLVAPLGDAIRGLTDLIGRGVATVRDFFAITLPSLLESVSRAISDLTSRAWSFMQSNIISPLTTALSGFADLVRRGVDTLYSFIARDLPALIGRIPDAVRDMASRAWDWIQANIISPLGRALGEFVALIGRGLESVRSFFVDTLPRLVGDVGRRLQDFFTSVGTWFQTNVVAPLSEAIRSVISFVLGGLDRVRAFFTDTLPGLIGGIPKAVESAVSTAWKFIEDRLISPFAGALSKFVDLVKSGIDLLAKFLLKDLPSYVEGVGKILLELPQKALEGLRVAGMTIWDYITKLGSAVTEGFAKVARILDDVGRNLYQVGVYLTGFVNAVMQLPERLGQVFKGVIDAFGTIGKFFESVATFVADLVADPGRWLRERVISPIASSLQWVGTEVWKGLTWMWEKAVGGFEWLAGKVRDLVSWVGTSFSKFFESVAEGVRALAESIRTAFSKIYEWVVESLKVPKELAEKSTALVSPTFSDILKSLGISSPPYLTPTSFVAALATSSGLSALIYASMVIPQLYIRATAFGIKGIARSLGELLSRFTISMKFLGLGADAEFNVGRALGAALWQLGEEIADVAKDWTRYSLMGMTFWYGTFLSRFLAYHLRNVVPVELPPTGTILESARRFRVSESIPPELGKSYGDIYDGLRYYLSVRGYSDYVVKALLAREDEMYTTIRDRFGVPRKIPLSLMYRIPPPTEVARMIIKDVVIPPQPTAKELEDTVTKLFMVSGMNKDLAATYFLLHFRYPTPATLARFYWRAMAGLTWMDYALVEPEILNAFGFAGADKAVTPTQLNFNADMLNYAMTKYLRWMDYLPGTWIPGFTSDASIILEMTADLPRRIDVRWLARWGIFEHLASIAKSLGKRPEDVMKVPPTEFANYLRSATGSELVRDRVTPEISLDVTLLARLLEGAGYHPYWVPALSVAWIHQVLADEMTLLRTGFLNAYKEGLITLDLSEKLMSGLFVITFKTGYIDTRTGTPAVFDYRKPVLWLPAERRLLQLRMAFDRHIDLTRDMLREVVSGLRRLALTEDDAKKIFKEYFGLVAKHWSAEVKAVSGVDWVPSIDESYLELWYEYASRLRDIEKRIWIRNYLARLAGWLLYRVSYGWLEKSDYDKFLQSLVKSGWLTEEEKEFFTAVFDWLSGIVAREYIPTPLTLATFAEYMVIRKEVVEKVFERLRVPEDFRPLYEEYIRVRPLKTDFKSLLSTARRALRAGAVPEEEWKKLLEEAKGFGFSDIEVSIIQRVADLEMAVEASREYLPAPATLATLSEYMTLPAELVRSVLEARKLPKEWVDIWMRYVSVRPVKSDFKSLLTTASRALVLNAIGTKEWDSYRSRAKQFGFTDAEVDLLDERVKLEEKVDGVRRYRQLFEPTPSFLATILEYVDTSGIEGFSKYLDSFFNTLQSLGVEQAVITAVKTYITSRPVKPDYRSLLTTALRAYRIGVIDEKKWKCYLDRAKDYGFTSREIGIIVERANLELMIEEAREYVPTPSMLATMSEYIAVPRELIEKVFKARRVPQEWQSIWLQYIRVRPLADDVRSLLTSYLRALRYGVAVPEDLGKEVKSYFALVGITETELKIRELAITLDTMIETLPTLSQLATMAEYIEVPTDYVARILTARRVEKTFAELWLKYISARAISSEVNTLVGTVRRIYEYFSLPEDLYKLVKDIMKAGGWVEREIAIFETDLALRKVYRVFTYLIPTVRQFVTDGQYLPNYTTLLEDILKARGMEVEKYKAQVDYYKKLLKNRRIWRHFSWYRTQLMYLYMVGGIDDAGVKNALSKFKDMGLLDDDEVSMILEGFKLRRQYNQIVYGR